MICALFKLISNIIYSFGCNYARSEHKTLFAFCRQCVSEVHTEEIYVVSSVQVYTESFIRVSYFLRGLSFIMVCFSLCLSKHHTKIHTGSSVTVCVFLTSYLQYTDIRRQLLTLATSSPMPTA